MKDLMAKIIEDTDLGIWPSVGLLLLMGTLIFITYWTYRPASKQDIENHSKLILD